MNFSIHIAEAGFRLRTCCIKSAEQIFHLVQYINEHRFISNMPIETMPLYSAQR